MLKMVSKCVIKLVELCLFFKLYATITADSLNDYFAAISDDVSYTAPSVKSTVNNRSAENHITEWRTFKLLDTQPPTEVGLDNIPAWFLRIGAPFFSAPNQWHDEPVIVFIHSA